MKSIQMFIGAILLLYAGTYIDPLFTTSRNPSNAQFAIQIGPQSIKDKLSISDQIASTNKSSPVQLIALVKQVVDPSRWAFYTLVLLILFWSWRRRRTNIAGISRAIFNHANVSDSSSSSQSTSKFIKRKDAAINEQAYHKVSKKLLANPFGAEYTGISIEQRVQIATEASLRVSRKVGVIVFRFADETNSQLANNQRRSFHQTEKTITRFRNILRKTDCVCSNTNNEVIVFISFLETKLELNEIANRLLSATLKDNGTENNKLNFLPGIAMYPLDGYNAEELVKTAKLRTEPVSKEASEATRSISADASRATQSSLIANKSEYRSFYAGELAH